MLTTATRDLFLLQSKSSVHAAERSQPRKADTLLNSRLMTYVDPEKETTKTVDPLQMLGCPSHLAATRRDLHLGGKGINTLHPNIQQFVNLETIVLTDNKLAKLTGLLPKLGKHPSVTECPLGCSRLKRLFLSNNMLTTLKGDIEELKYLETLLLANNFLTNMETVSKQLRHLNYLKQLDLFGNPVSEEQNYRPYFIFHHPSLELLDRKVITDEERAEAAAIWGNRGHNGNHSGGSVGRTGSSRRMTSGRESNASSTLPSRRDLATPQQAAGQCDGSVKGHAFGSTFIAPPAQTDRRKGDEVYMSASAALVESKVKTIVLKRAADAMREATKAQQELEEINEARQAFHSIWELAKYLAPSKEEPASNLNQSSAPAGKGAAVKAQPAPVAQTHTQPLGGDSKAHPIQLPAVLPKSSLRTEDPLQSSLFTLSNVEQHAQVRQAIAVARELLSADTNEKKYALAEKLRRLLPMMIPERSSDSFSDALEQFKSNQLSLTTQQYLQRMIQSLLTPTELGSLRKMFPDENGPSIDVAAWSSIVAALEDPTLGGITSSLQEAFRHEYNIPLTPKIAAASPSGTNFSNTATRKSIVGSKAAMGRRESAAAQAPAVAISLDQALQHLVCFIPFVETRPAFLQQLSAKALKGGDGDTAKAFLQRYNDSNLCHQTLRMNAKSGEHNVFIKLMKLR